ncbi:hypothetical protein PsorP6_009343 [Peronosclerospora sorghi]|uniref:Uncharacterized protein n=1 Tax=Peronosclerospora sorghi TaxID=230839 RepID=A0ACC0W0Q6_9STRA|nr:hypothetical protein PsorP6_009343 [Peronosclerospora sorghi]
MSEHEAATRRSNARTRTCTRPDKARQWTHDDGMVVRNFPRLHRGSWHRSRDEHVVRPLPPSRAPKAPAQPFHVGIELSQILTRTTARCRKTKIICAIGPASWSVEMLGKLLDAGMNVARLNFSHGDHAMHLQSLTNLRRAMAARPDCHCAVLLDTKGPEIRSGLLKGHVPVQLKVGGGRGAGRVRALLYMRNEWLLTWVGVAQAGQMLEITTDYAVEGDRTRIACTYAHLPTSVSIGSTILCDDGSLVMTVVECRANAILVQVENDHVLEEKKNINLPGRERSVVDRCSLWHYLCACGPVVLTFVGVSVKLGAAIQIPGITAKDEEDLRAFAIPHGVDIVSGSFVRSAANVRAIRQCLGEAGRRISVHAKIESLEALQKIDEIIAEADGIHVSRGDLGMELSPERVVLAQKMIIEKANRAGKPVVTSTQMLQSMTTNLVPSNAECTDVANAVLDGTDAVMLSAETAKGMYPQQAVATMARICVEAEQALDYAEVYRLHRAANRTHVSLCESVASSAVEISLDMNVPLIVSITETGRSTKLLAKYRPRANILAVTASTLSSRQLTGVSRGVTALVVEAMIGIEEVTLQAIAYAKKVGLIQCGELVILVHGLDDGVSSSTNGVKVIEVAKEGYSSPRSSFRSGMQVPFT